MLLHNPLNMFKIFNIVHAYGLFIFPIKMYDNGNCLLVSRIRKSVIRLHGNLQMKTRAQMFFE